MRRLRGVLILGCMWAAVWLPVGVVLAVANRWTALPPRIEDLTALGAWTGVGFFSGVVFALLLARLERNQTVDTLSPNRLLRWGALAGAGVPIGLSALLIMLLPPDIHLAPSAYPAFALLGLTGAATALATLRLAKRGRDAAR